jgi:3-oxoacyl-[acyl-carrier protein] reductase
MPIGPHSLRLDGRIALVTGAAAGIGRAVALAFAAAGADLALCDRDEAGLARLEGEVRRDGRRAFCAVLDVREVPAVDAFFARIRDEAGGLDALVNNAGGTFHGDFASLRARGEEALVRENWSQVAHVTRASLALFPASGGSIVNVTSVEAHRAAPGYAVYAAMKAAVESLTRSLALELAERRIRVNAIAPDAIPTPGLEGAAPPTPLPDPGHPDDVAGAALYLVSDLARFVTGTTLHVDGGTHAAGGWRRDESGAFAL